MAIFWQLSSSKTQPLESDFIPWGFNLLIIAVGIKLKKVGTV